MTHLLDNREQPGEMRAACGRTFADQRSVQMVARAGSHLVTCAECKAIVEQEDTEVIPTEKA